jgi:mannose-6-phosphate isomerase-like protein (cupin superfamily)
MIETAAQARVHDMRFGQARILVDGERSAGAWWLGMFRQDPGFATPLHIHHKTDEYLFVLEGNLAVFLDGKWHDLAAGAMAMVPHGTPHAQRTAGPESVRILGAGNPGGFEHFFAAQHELLSRIPPSDPGYFAELGKILAKYDTAVLGMPPG